MYKVLFNRERVHSGSYKECADWIQGEGHKIYGSGNYQIKLALV